MKNTHKDESYTLTETEKKMLALLVKGASSKKIAQSLGYKDGTARVYLSALYKHIGVANKTSAVTWYIARQSTESVSQNWAQTPPELPEDTFGDRAIRTDLLSSLGIMEIFLGPHSKMWEVANRLNAATAGADTNSNSRIRAQSRKLWCALLAGDFAKGKQEFDQGGLSGLFVDSPGDAVVLASLVILGGYTSSGKKALAAMPQKKAATIGITRDERRALLAMADATEGHNEHALGALHHLAANAKSRPTFRHLITVALFHIYKVRSDIDRARATADAVWAEAESVRQQLSALGDHPLSVDSHLPEPPAFPRATLNTYLEKLQS